MINIAGIIEESYTDGVGIRCTIFTQGCSHNCKGCQNPETHTFGTGKMLDNKAIMEYMKSNPLLDGITFSGGDPMDQAKDCAELAKQVKEETNLNVWCYTGYTIEQLTKPDQLEFLKYIDVLVDGPYMEEKRKLTEKFRGSTNQRIIDVQEYLKTGNIKIKDV